MQKIRVAHLLNSFGTGGLEKGVATIIKNSSKLFEHLVICTSTSGDSIRLLPTGTKVFELHKPVGNSLSFILRLARFLKHAAPDVLHTRNWGGIDGIIAAHLVGIFTVVHGEHGWEISDLKGLNLKRRLVRKFLARWVKEFTCVSKDMERWLTQDVKVNKRTTQIYNGIDTSIYYPGSSRSALKWKLRIPEETLLIGTIGRLDPIKDHPTLFQAFKNIRKNYQNIQLLVVGDGTERNHLSQIAPDSVCFLGNRTDIPEILRSLDIFVLPSINEGISNTILEAMATGLPVIATAVGGNPELVKDGVTGTLVPARDPTALSSALYNYLENPNMRRLHGEAARIRSENYFNIKTMVKGYESIYRRVVSMEYNNPI